MRPLAIIGDVHGDAQRLEALFDPQTSGGLLLVVPPQHADRLLNLAEMEGEPMWVVGDVVAGQGVEVA